ncbi:MAG: hypothetical protein MZV65_24040 [Chromatiales bacterium]|nr:hypothetical protein [Chromatiales bacterium]
MTLVSRPRSLRVVHWWLLLLMLQALAGCTAGRPLVSSETGPASVADSPVSAAAPVPVPAAPTPVLDEDRSHALESIDSEGYGMLYFPSAGQGVRLVTDMALNRLYEDALPGYGLYTFVLLGTGFERASGDDLTRHSEFFRMIETYVANSGGDDGPSPEAHVFLIPVRSGRSPMAPLMDLVAADLSDLMRRRLGELLRQRGQARLAARIERGAGPVLVAGLEPSLLPLDGESPRLVADLSGFGPEHVYGLVDAYDHDIPPELSGRPESLSALRQRLLELSRQSRSAGGGSGREADDRRWIFLI